MTNPNPGSSDLEILKNMVLQQQSQIATLTDTIRQASAPVPQTPREYTTDELRDNPQLVLEQMRAHTAALIAPLQETAIQSRRAMAYKSAKERVKIANPKFAKIWDKIVGQLDMTFESGQFEPTEQLINFQVSALAGQYLMDNPTALIGNDNTTPPFIDPSGAPIPNQAPVKPLRDLTPNEETIRKFNNMSKEDFLKGLEDDNAMVVYSRGGK